MKPIHILLACLTASVLPLAAQNRSDANITGHVVKKGTDEHLPFITVHVKNTTISTSTDGTGHFYLKHLPVGELTLSASAIGYGTVEHTVKTEPNRLIEVNFELEEEVIGMDDIVVSASRNESNRRSSPTIVNVVSTKLFETTASHNLTESMNFQSGLRVENSCSNCGTTQLRINGLDGQYSQILIDSRPIFSSLAGVYGLEQLPVTMVERVEVIRGGGSALFGANAIGGVVNIITKEPIRNTLSIAHDTGLIGGKKTDLNTSLNASFVSDDYKAGVYLFGMVKNRHAYDRNGDGFSNLPKINSETVGFRGYYKTSPYSKLTAEYHHIHEFRRGGDNLGRPPHEAMVAEQLDHKIDGGGMKFDWFTPDDRHRVGLYASAQRIDRESYFGTDMNPDAYGTTDDATYVTGAQYTFSADRFLFSPSELTAGFEFSHNNLHDRILGYGRDFKQVSDIAGGFLQNEWRTDRFSALIGGRLDKHNMMDHVVFSPRTNFRYSPNERAGFRISYSSGYRAPQAYDEDLHVDAVGGTVSLIELAEGLKPEYSHSVSGSADLYRNFGRLQTNLLLEGFYTTLKDVFTLVQYGEEEINEVVYRRLRRENASGATVRGLNAEIKAGIPSVFEFQAGYTFQKSSYKDPFRWTEELTPQKKMFRAPDHYGYFTSVFYLSKAFNFSVFGNYTGSMLVQHITARYDAAGEIEEFYSEKKTRGFMDAGIKATYDIKISSHAGMEINGGVKNVFDQFQKDLDYGPLKDAAYVYGPTFPRTFFLGLKFYM